MNSTRDIEVREFLDRLERLEERLLVWGAVDGSFTQEEIEKEAESFLEARATETTIEDLIERLVAPRLLFYFNEGTGPRYRTRMAESLRLLARLRQMFPQRDWKTSPTLVADFRFSLRPRRYPDRNITPESARKQLKDSIPLSRVQDEILQALLHPAGTALNLAEFQLRSTLRMLADLRTKSNRGIIVSAGTGTGKTLAFYLPALTYVGAQLAKARSCKVLALYPRSELLKDQFSETLQQCRLLNPILVQTRGRKLSIATFYGGTPYNASEQAVREKKWEHYERQGYVCPVLRCPNCDKLMIWRTSDIKAKIERLVCADSRCATIVESDEIVLTRQRMQKEVPDFLFTTTEMLNRQLSSSDFGHLFGIGNVAKPEIVLLDEVHTYIGTHGAQVAHLLRRWRRAVGSPMQFTGLSATLRNAPTFFAELIGLSSNYIAEISPAGEMIEEGMEYQVALRGDPVSATSLLSTTIQASFLLARLLEHEHESNTTRLYARKLYVFTDDLDITNRLYHNLLDAEGLNSWGRPRPGKGPLATLRSSAAPDPEPRFRDGQHWRLSEQIGHELNHSLKIGRTSSQDTGVDRGADIVVATASLEVGYNDPAVGAVLQHKAPHDAARFIQRKGRAGRRRNVRPWTVVVLSDFGRDRLAYQGYEHLFDPSLEHRSLPIGNRYVLRMQAAYAFIDWVATRIPFKGKGSCWRDYIKAGSNGFLTERQRWHRNFLAQFLEDEKLRQDFEQYLQSALKLSEDDVLSVLWEPPRAIMTSFVPTLLRRLETSWRRIDGGEDNPGDTTPMPDFLPVSLFSDLNLPDVAIQIHNRRETLPIFQAMSTFAVGNVTRRFSPDRANVSHWIAPPNLEDPEQEIELEVVCSSYFPEGSFNYSDDGVDHDVLCFRPWSVTPTECPYSVLPTSRGQLVWRTQIFPVGNELSYGPPSDSAWSSFVQSLGFYIQNQNGYVTVRRFATGAEANIRKRQKQTIERRIKVDFRRAGLPASIGFSQNVDGFVVKFRMPAQLRMDPNDVNQPKIRGYRTAYFQHRVEGDPVLLDLANFFEAGHLAQIYLSLLTAFALSQSIPLSQANTMAQGTEELPLWLDKVLGSIFQTIVVEEGENAEEGGGERRQKVHERLRELCRDRKVTIRLGELATVLWAIPDEHWFQWAEQRFKATLGGAILDACHSIAPEVDSDSLFVDADAGLRPPGEMRVPEGIHEIWITEKTLGGTGVVEEVLQRFAEDPRRFYRLIEAGLSPSDFEIVDATLTRILELLQSDIPLQQAFAQVRDAQNSNEQLRLAVSGLRTAIIEAGLSASHPVLAAIHARLLKAGTNPQFDLEQHQRIVAWHEAEEKLGIEIDARVFSYIEANKQLGGALQHLPENNRQQRQFRFQLIYALLWPRGNAVRSRALQTYNPFATISPPDREILRDCLMSEVVEIDAGNLDFRAKARAALKDRGSARLIATLAKRQELKTALLYLASEPVELGFLFVYPQIESIRLNQQIWEANLVCREALQ